MTIDRIASRQLPEYIKREESPGFRFDSGPYIGIVKDNRDPTRSGKLQVWIAELGGDEKDPKFWRTVSYASPYLGYTYTEPYTVEHPQPGSSDKNSFKTVRHSYGMWCNVPDLGNFVLCTFIAGDASRGFYFASIPNQLGHHMVPAISSSSDVDKEHIEDSKVKSLCQAGKIGPELPVVEFNEFNTKVNWETFVREKKPLHEPQVKILIEQGLDRPNLTKSRGSITSTSQRETPAGVFGISTPGRSITAPPRQDARVEERKIKTRMGGHTFVMDDGDNSSQKGKNNLTRWRSSAGHQILMDDIENVIYIANSNGSTWVEMTGSGHINIYSSNSVNLRTKADLNLHVDKDLNLQVDGNFNLKVKKALNIETNTSTLRSLIGTKIFSSGPLELGSDTSINIQASISASLTAGTALMLTGNPLLLNSGQGPSVIRPRDLPIKKHSDTKKDGNGQWIIEPNKIKSISKIVPTHEPWERKSGTDSSASNAPYDANSRQSESVIGNSPPDFQTVSANLSTSSPIGQAASEQLGNRSLSIVNDLPGIADANSRKTTGLAPDSYMKNATAPQFPNGLGDGLLSPDQAKALAVQLGYNESRGDYKQENDLGYLGKYQFGAQSLVDMGYIKRSAWEQTQNNSVLKDANAWTGKDGIRGKEDFLSSPGVQENTYSRYLEKNLSTGLSTGYISRSDPPEVIGGKLAVASLLGTAGAKKWLNSGQGADAYGSTGSAYFNRGRLAIERLAGNG